MNEKEKMISGSIYDPNDSELINLRRKAHALCYRYNNTLETDFITRETILNELFPNHGNNVYIQGPLQVDYGCFTSIGENTYANFNLTILDTCPVKIGKNVFIGPNVSILTALHPLRYQDRNVFFNEETNMLTDKEYGAPITINDNCWIAGNVTIIGGVNIGEGCVIGAGSVVTKDIPPNSLAFGNPCRVIKEISQKDKI